MPLHDYLKGEIRKLRAFSKEYGGHTSECACHQTTTVKTRDREGFHRFTFDKNCDCGYEQKVKELGLEKELQ